MLSRLTLALAMVALLVTSATAQVVRFETTVGDFDMVLNRTGEARLQGYVDNFLQYVEEDRYLGSWINRAENGFVLQMGGLFSNTKRPPLTINSVRSVFSHAQVAGEPAITFSSLSNTVGTVSLALSGSPANPDSGSNSFFINLRDNSTGLDGEFTVFAAIPDMTVVNQIMALSTTDLTADPLFGAGAGSLTFNNVPLRDNGYQVFIKRAFVVTDAMTVASATAAVQPVMSASAAAFADGSGGSAMLTSAAATVPEPASGVLLVLGTLVMLAAGRRACRR